MEYLIAAYVVVIVGVAGYAALLARERRRLEAQLEADPGAPESNRS